MVEGLTAFHSYHMGLLKAVKLMLMKSTELLGIFGLKKYILLLLLLSRSKNRMFLLLSVRLQIGK